MNSIAPTRAQATNPRRENFKSFWVLFSVGLLYVSFGVCFGLLEYGIPPILMSRGVDLQAMGWVIALYVPFGLTFVWAPLIDQWRLPWLSYRIGWIVLAQCVSSLLLVGVAFGAGLSAASLFCLGLAICFAVATMDLALDALAVDIIGARYRSMAASLKVGALAIGGLLGGGVLVGLFDRLGWQGTFLLTAGLPVLTALPVLALTRADPPRPLGAKRASVWVTLRRPGVLQQLLLLSLTTTAVIAMVYFQRPILIEMGVPLASIGWGLGTLSPLLNTLAAVLVIPALSRGAASKTLGLLVLLSALAAGGMVWSIHHGSTQQVMTWSLVQGMSSSALSVIIYTLILKWAASEQSATDYAVLCGSSRLLATLLLMAVPALLRFIDWSVFYGACVVVLVVLALLIRREVQLLSLQP